MKKALIVSSTGGFLSQFLDNDVNLLQERGYEIHYASDFQNPIYEFDEDLLKKKGIVFHSITLHKKPWHFIQNARGLIQLIGIIKKEKIDLVHCHNPVGGMLGRLSAFCSGRRPYVIYTAHGFHFFEGAPIAYWIIFYPIERILALFTDVIITINREDFNRAGNFHLKRGGFVELMGGVGLDTERFHPRKKIRDEVRRELNIPEHAFHIVTAAELNDNKNHMVILEALKLLSDKDILYSICGRGTKQEELLGYIRRNRLGDTVHLLGYRTDMERVLQSADAFVFPSKREGFGMAAVEALGCGVPVIAADNRGTREYMKNHINGIVCDSEDVNAFAYAINDLKNDDEKRAGYAINALKYSKEFSKASSKEKLRKIYDRAGV